MRPHTDPSRRTFLTAALATAPAAIVFTQASSMLSASAADAPVAVPNADPALLHSTAQLSIVGALARAGTEPWATALQKLSTSWHATANWTSFPYDPVLRGGAGQNYVAFYRDVHAAYQNALQWQVSKDEAHGATAAKILNGWATTLKTLGGNADRFLASGIYGYQLANAAELVRGRSDFDEAAMSEMLLRIFYPMQNDFLTNHNGATITNYWANWDLANMAGMLAVGGFTGRADIIAQAIDYFHNGAGNGSIMKAVPFLVDDGQLGQWQESGRDQAHTQLGVGLMGTFCEMAWNLGYDCYGAADNRFYKGAQYVAKYNLGNDVPFEPYTWKSGPNSLAGHVGWATQTQISSAMRGSPRPIWDMLLGHYGGRRGLPCEWISQIAATVRIDGGGGTYGNTSGGYDHLGFTTLTGTTPPALRLRSFDQPGFVMGYGGGIANLTSDTTGANTAFRIVPGRSGSAGGTITFECVDRPGFVLRHGRFVLHPLLDDGTAGCAADSTFIVTKGLSDPLGVTFRPRNYPDLVLRHQNFRLRLDPPNDALTERGATFSWEL